MSEKILSPVIRCTIFICHSFLLVIVVINYF
jgi:hypothetical protein